MNMPSTCSQSGSSSTVHILEGNEIEFRENLNQSSFQFFHQLANHPLFKLPRSVEMAHARLAKGGQGISCMSRYSSVDQKWSSVPYQEQIIESIAHMDSSESFAMLTIDQSEPEYKRLLNQIVVELESLTGDLLRKEITWLDAYLFISSPNTVTPYHVDHETNFLMQIQGEKDVHLFDPFDRSILTDIELERYYIGDREFPYYKSEKQSAAKVYHLTPGVGIHHPSTAPHWVQNGNQVSISLSINFFMRSLDQKARIYQINHYLRQLGIAPTPPDRSAWKDALKIFTLGVLSKRHPQNKNEVLRSGLNRLKAPVKAIQQLNQQFINCSN